ncbi:YfbM family protein [Luteimonas sp. BDR2-5]|uniref:YfbM family protein n=1 Tax=Proluteimonas luteida TaxID=2878685 RepID=UPI001E287320|nr:YfbM family protein [Luteimonas sp. BDR2-5]MCD9029575.1 YfbM family protein [Luteimonas sp. BDR2-5]
MGMAACFAAIDSNTAARLRSNPEEVEGYLFPDDGDGEPDNYADVDKAWHGIHYLLNGSADGGDSPLSWAVMGGAEVGEDIGYGPARILTPEQVKAISDALPSEDAFKASYAPEAMKAAQIYPDVIWLRDGDEALDYLVENYKVMVEFYRSAASRGDGAILWLC